MKLLFIILLSIIYVNSVQAMNDYQDQSELYFTTVCEHKYILEHDENNKHFINALEKMLQNIVKNASSQLNQFANKYRNLIYASKERPSMIVVYTGNLNEDTKLLEWDYSFQCIPYYPCNEAEVIQFQEFKAELEKILFHIKSLLSVISFPDSIILGQDTSIELKIRIYFQESEDYEENPECLSFNTINNILNYWSELHSAFRW